MLLWYWKGEGGGGGGGEQNDFNGGGSKTTLMGVECPLESPLKIPAWYLVSWK